MRIVGGKDGGQRAGECGAFGGGGGGAGSGNRAVGDASIRLP